MTKDTGIAAGLLALSGLYWLGADQIKVSRLEGIVGAQAVPKGLAVSLAILAALLIVQDVWQTRSTAGGSGDAAGEIAGTAAHLRAAGILLIGAAYLVVVGTIGYPLAIALLLLATARYMGRPWSAELCLVAVGGAVLYDVIFVHLLGIPLPPGIWPGVWRSLAG